MKTNFADRLLEAIEGRSAPVCVGIDPRHDRLPDELREGTPDELESLRTFCMGVLEAVAPHVPAVKPQSAYFERYGGAGVALYFDVIARARELGLLVVGDVKRNDIGSTAEAYAAGHVEAPGSPDAITVNGYLGSDGLKPFIDAARRTGRGLFVLVRTSNPSAGEVQDFAGADGTKLYAHVARNVAKIGDGEGLVGEAGYSCVGAVVGATWPQEARELREIMSRQLILVPGYGAQGATAADCAASFDADGRGAIVNASRSVIYAHAREEYADKSWQAAVAAAAEAFVADIRQAVMP